MHSPLAAKAPTKKGFFYILHPPTPMGVSGFHLIIIEDKHCYKIVLVSIVTLIIVNVYSIFTMGEATSL
jgi:hypothetical protein